MSRGLPAFPAGSVVTCGSFDGVHLGHQAVLREVKARAERLGAASVVVTFEPDGKVAEGIEMAEQRAAPCRPRSARPIPAPDSS